MRSTGSCRPFLTHGSPTLVHATLIAATLSSGWRPPARSSRRRSVPAEHTYDYAIIRVVPRVERGEQVNVGVIISVADSDFLDARIEMDEAAVRGLDPSIDIDAVKEQLAVIPRVCRGGPRPARSVSCRRAAASAGWCRRAARSSSPHRCTPGERPTQ